LLILIVHSFSQFVEFLTNRSQITTLCAKGTFGTCPRPPFGQKIVPIFSFFLFGPGYFNYDYRKGIFFVADKSPTLGYFNYGPTFTEFFSGKKINYLLFI
jgi:hypothetical protein